MMPHTLVGTFIIFLSIVGCFGQGSGGGASSGGETEQTVTNLTVTDVCTSTRTKQDFCNTDTVCESTGIIQCFANDLGAIFPCPPETPYCIGNDDGASCSATIDSTCESTSTTSSFVCTSLGYFPNVRDCNALYICGVNEEGTSLLASVDRCPSGYVFDASSASSCSRRNVFNCVTMRCQDVTKTTYVQLTYVYNKQYYAVCTPGGDLDNPLIFSCPTGTEPNLSAFPAKCNYRCSRAGNFPNSLSKSRYYQCYWNEVLRLVSAERSCPLRTEFNSQTSRCEPIIRSNEAEVDENFRLLL